MRIDDWDFTGLEQYGTKKQLKKRETFWQNRLKSFYFLMRKRRNGIYEI